MVGAAADTATAGAPALDARTVASYKAKDLSHATVNLGNMKHPKDFAKAKMWMTRFVAEVNNYALGLFLEVPGTAAHAVAAAAQFLNWELDPATLLPSKRDQAVIGEGATKRMLLFVLSESQQLQFDPRGDAPACTIWKGVKNVIKQNVGTSVLLAQQRLRDLRPLPSSATWPDYVHLHDSIVSIHRTLEQEGNIYTDKAIIRLYMSFINPTKKNDARQAETKVNELITAGELDELTVTSFMAQFHLIVSENATSRSEAEVRWHVPDRRVNQVSADKNQSWMDTRRNQPSVRGPISPTHAADLRDRTCFNCHQPGHSKSNCPQYNRRTGASGGAAMLGGTGASAEGAGARGGRQPSEDPTTRKCYRCGQAGHVIASCPQAPNNVSAVTSRQRRHGHNREVVNVFTDYGN
jgi:hypothetical protein